MTITRLDSSHRMSQAVIHNGTVHLSGIVGNAGESVTEQTSTILRTIENLLVRSGSSREHIISATIWLADMGDFEAMNRVWDAWVEGIAPPARATGETRLASTDYKIEIIITAAVA
jgi:enamine deaminase RidA (YjgF/YER057c/UK114 family)